MTLQFPSDMVLTPVSRNPLRLEEATRVAILERPLPHSPCTSELLSPTASVIVVTYNNLVFSRICLESVLLNTEASSYELIIVDNASTDGTEAYLRELDATHSQVRVIRNPGNRGFPVAVNQGLRAARGKFVVLLNNDTIVAPGWLTTLVAHLQDHSVGLVGPTTNRIGNEAEVEVSYRTLGEFLDFAQEQMERSGPAVFDIRTAAMFCVAMRRDTLGEVGLLDEQFETGMFEDDDYSLRVRAAGLRVVCADNVFVHHFGGASFGTLAASGEYGAIFHRNRQRWEEKWQRPWTTYQRRPNSDYEELVRQVKATIERVVPAGSRIMIVSRGDDAFLALPNHVPGHFPQDHEGRFAGHNPRDSAAAIEQLERLRQEGVDSLVFIRTTLWWLEFYEELSAHLHQHGRKVFDQRENCVIFRFAEESLVPSEDGERRP